jgi:glycine dehydrogenase
VHRLAAILKAGLGRLGFAVPTGTHFDTIAVASRTPHATHPRLRIAHGVNLRRIDEATLGISLDETTTREDVERLWQIFTAGDVPFSVADLDAVVNVRAAAALMRTSTFLTHPVFHRYHSETEMLRYLRRLADCDLALDRAMIPLGSCTMKLNATLRNDPGDLARVRRAASVRARGAGGRLSPAGPRARANAVRGHRLRRRLAAAQRGSQGEYAGLLMIRAYHESRGEGASQA